MLVELLQAIGNVEKQECEIIKSRAILRSSFKCQIQITSKKPSSLDMFEQIPPLSNLPMNSDVAHIQEAVLPHHIRVQPRKPDA